MTVALQGEQGKPRPAVVLQSDRFLDLTAVTVLPITSYLTDSPLLRIDVLPTRSNGLTRPSQIMVDKPQTPSRDRIGPIIGRLDDGTLAMVTRAVALFLGIT